MSQMMSQSPELLSELVLSALTKASDITNVVTLRDAAGIALKIQKSAGSDEFKNLVDDSRALVAIFLCRDQTVSKPTTMTQEYLNKMNDFLRMLKEISDFVESNEAKSHFFKFVETNAVRSHFFLQRLTAEIEDHRKSLKAFLTGKEDSEALSIQASLAQCGLRLVELKNQKVNTLEVANGTVAGIIGCNDIEISSNAAIYVYSQYEGGRTIGIGSTSGLKIDSPTVIRVANGATNPFQTSKLAPKKE
ncbi:hypothetical protein H0H93_008212 [Arthromyces matolae]|nr:hypothetical protein H0H93_008212 [Arthromyces matolae]